MEVEIICANDLEGLDKSGTSDPYVAVLCNDEKIFKSKTIPRNNNPIWHEQFEMKVTDLRQTVLTFFVKDYERTGKNRTIGQCALHVKDVVSVWGDSKEMTLPLVSSKGTLRVKACWYAHGGDTQGGGLKLMTKGLQDRMGTSLDKALSASMGVTKSVSKLMEIKQRSREKLAPPNDDMPLTPEPNASATMPYDATAVAVMDLAKQGMCLL